MSVMGFVRLADQHIGRLDHGRVRGEDRNDFRATGQLDHDPRVARSTAARLPHPPPIVQAAGAAEGFQRGEDVGQARFPAAAAGEVGGKLGFGLCAW